MEATYGHRVHLFEQKYGHDFRNAIPCSPPKPLYLPVSIIEAARAENYLEVSKFLGPLPIPLQRLNAISQNNGDTLLHIATQTYQHDIVKVLLALGAEVNVTNGDNLTPMHFAVRLQGDDESIAKTLIRWGAKKSSMILYNPSALAGVDSLLAAAADFSGKSEISRMMESEAIGRHCKFQVDEIAKRGTIVKDDSVAHFQILLDDTKESIIVIKHSVEISKPLLFDFRDIDRAVLFPTPPPRQMEPPGRRRRYIGHGIERNSRNSSRQPLVQLMHGASATMNSQALRQLHQRAVETIQAMSHSQDRARAVLHIHQEVSAIQGFETSSTSRAFIQHMQESIAARDDDIQSMRDATSMLHRRVERLRQRAEHGNSVAVRRQLRQGSQDAREWEY